MIRILLCNADVGSEPVLANVLVDAPGETILEALEAKFTLIKDQKEEPKP